jgi:hypothetical protein
MLIQMSSLNSIDLLQAHPINLRLILVSGKTKEFLFSSADSAADVAQHVFDNWPLEWTDEAVPRAEILRLIYQGRFLHGNVTLGGNSNSLPRNRVITESVLISVCFHKWSVIVVILVEPRSLATATRKDLRDAPGASRKSARTELTR